MARDPKEANTCTIELSTGSFIEVADTPGVVMALRYELLSEKVHPEMMGLTPLIGANRPDAEWREKVWVDPRCIVAVFPLDEHSQPPHQVSLDRVEAQVGRL